MVMYGHKRWCAIETGTGYSCNCGYWDQEAGRKAVQKVREKDKEIARLKAEIIKLKSNDEENE